MEIFLVTLAAFLRPILFIDFTGGGELSNIMELFNAFAMGLFALLAMAWFSNVALRKNINFTVVDLLMAAFGIWCIAISIIYPDKAYWREVIKLVFPLFVYFVVKNVLRDTNDYLGMLRALLIGFTVPVLWSSVSMLTGGGIESINYWTQVMRYRGVYPAAHVMAHNMTFFIMALTVYLHLKRNALKIEPAGKVMSDSKWFYALAAICAVFALYGLGMAQVRNAMLGLVVFVGVYLFSYHRGLFVFSTFFGVVVLVGLALQTDVLTNLFWEIEFVESGMWGAEELAAGRPRIWRNNWEIYSAMPVDRLLAGVGIGNKDIFGGTEGIVDSHNDYLDVLIQAGIVGVLIYLALQFVIMKRILSLPAGEKYLFLAVFVAVVVMNFTSNSYITRSGMAQML